MGRGLDGIFYLYFCDTHYTHAPRARLCNGCSERKLGIGLCGFEGPLEDSLSLGKACLS